LVDTSDLDRLDLKVDYGLSTHDLYQNLAIASLKGNCNLDILSACRVSEEQDAISLLPSWVPNWKISDTAVSLLLQGFLEEEEMDFSATNSSAYSPKIPEHPSLLYLEGHFLRRF
jgi:hypothetical protein